MSNFDCLPDIECVTDLRLALSDPLTNIQSTSNLEKGGTIVGGACKISVMNTNDMLIHHLWFDPNTGDRIEEPEWLQENNRMISKCAEAVEKGQHEEVPFESEDIPERKIRDNYPIGLRNLVINKLLDVGELNVPEYYK